MTLIDITFSKPPGPDSCFVDTHLSSVPNGPEYIGVGVGEWIDHEDGFWSLRIDVNPDTIRTAYAR